MEKLISISLLFFLLSACDNPKTVSYYVEHPDEMKVKLEECNDDITKLAKDGDCINARGASRKLFFKPVHVNKHNKGPGLFPLEEKN